MREQLSRVWSQIRDIVTKMTQAQRIVSAVILVAVVAGLSWVIASGTGIHWVKAGSIQDPDELRAAEKALEARGIAARMGDGDAIEVHTDKLGEARMVLMAYAEDSGADVGMELFDKSTFGQSARQEQINYVRAMEGELARSIRTIDAVRSARVHLAIPERTVFIREEKKPTASVTVALKDGASLDKKQVRAIQRLVSNAIPGMAPDGVAMVGDDGTMLSQNGGDGGGETGFELKDLLERDTERRVMATLERIVGVGKARVQVAATMDFSEVREETVDVDPDRQAITHEKTGEESSSTETPEPEGPAGVAGNDPARAGGAAAKPKASKSKRNEERTYENAVTRRTTVQGGARVKQLAVSVVVDGIWTRTEGAEASWAPRSPADLEQISQAVKVGTGLDATRGDMISVVSLKFEDLDGAALVSDVVAPAWQSDLVRWSVLLLVVLAFVFGVVRPALNLMKERGISLQTGPELALAGGMPGGVELPRLDVPQLNAAAAGDRHGDESGEPELSVEEEMARIQDQAKRDADEAKAPVLTLGEQLRLQAIEATKQNPARAVQLVRAWLTREK